MCKSAFVSALLGIALVCCRSPADEAPPDDSGAGKALAFADRAKHQLESALVREAAKNSAELLELDAEGFRLLYGARNGAYQSRREAIAAQIAKDPDKLVSPGARQLVIADAQRSLVVRIMKEVWAYNGDSQPGRFLQASTLRHDAAGRATELVLWLDMMTVSQQAGFKRLPKRPAREKPWREVFEVSATGSETEASNEVHARSFLDAIERQDVADAMDLVADDFVDRDVAAPTSSTYPTPEDFAEAIGSWFDRAEAWHFAVLDLWSAGDWVVAEVRHAYRLASDLPGHPGSAKQQALNYELWLLRLSDGKLTSRWRFRDSFTEAIELGTLDEDDFARQRRAFQSKGK